MEGLTIDVTPEALGELSRIRRLLEEIAAAVVEPSGGVDEPRKLEWAGAGGFEDVDFGADYAGVLIINETNDVLHVGFAPGTGTAARRLLRVSANGWISLPKRCSFVSVGGVVAGSAVVFPLRSAGAAPAMGA